MSAVPPVWPSRRLGRWRREYGGGDGGEAVVVAGAPTLEDVETRFTGLGSAALVAWLSGLAVCVCVWRGVAWFM